MKKIFLIMLLSGLLFTAFSQVTVRIPVVTDSVFFYADSISTTITLGKNEFLGQIWIDASRTESITMQLYDASKQQWSFIDDNGAEFGFEVADSSVDYVIPIEPRRLYLGKVMRIIIDNDPADTLSMRYDKRPY